MASDPFVFAATGDAILAPSVSELKGREGFDTLCALFRSADAAVTQVEPVLVTDETTHAALRQVTDQYQYLAPYPGAIMGTSPRVLDDLTDIGLNLFTVASNHAFDFGETGVRSTLSAMHQRELQFAGIGRHLAEARSPVYLDTDAGQVGLVNATTSVPPGGEARVSTSAFDGASGVNPLHVEWTYRMDPEQLDQLQTIASQTGLDRVKGEWLRRENQDWRAADEYYFMQMRCAPTTETQPPGVYHSIHERDREALRAGISEADATADWVILALHVHQSRGGNRNTSEAPQFLEEFAHDCVETGADAVVVTGPHTLRGIEVYQNRPIFYSLGNFFFQEEVIHRMPASVSQAAESEIPDVRGADAVSEAESTVAHDADNWQSIVPVCEFETDGTLTDVTLYPCTLQPRAPRPRRGTPVLADGDIAQDILRTLADRSAPYGTTITVEEATGTVEIA